ncbi:helix-turn-helix transcriptional regulator [Lactococcus chungangensis]|jgi:Helix-turn-helix.|uniref:helix-turn-helix transcriptional regulator n=1 Tax=Pseudolactococcus chungangensis TaxID=451457 RepID=UPI0028D7F864|nr:helix-turn-helix transcriptional regulator [Lactococcus chungangensis]
MAVELNERRKQIKRLQDNLSSIRKIAGWSAEVFGEKLGVTKQTISNLENQKTPMSFIQYIAIRSVLDTEIENNKESEVLQKAVAILLDSDDELDEDKYNEVQKSLEKVAATAVAGISGVALVSVFVALVPLTGALLSLENFNWKKLLE